MTEEHNNPYGHIEKEGSLPAPPLAHRVYLLTYDEVTADGSQHMEVLQRENFMMRDGWAIFSNGREYTVPTQMLAIRGDRLLRVEEITHNPDEIAEKYPALAKREGLTVDPPTSVLNKVAEQELSDGH